MCLNVCLFVPLTHFSLAISTQENSWKHQYKGPSPFTSSSPLTEAAMLPRQQLYVNMKEWRWNSSIKTAWERERGYAWQQKSPWKERPENFCFCLDHPGQITLLEVCLPELRGPALPLTFQRGVICKCTVIWKVHCEKCQGAALSILWRAQLGASLKTKQLRDWWSGMHR